MNCVPVIEMEMRSASRRAWTFRLRLLFVVAACATCLVVLVLPSLPPAQKGRTMLVLLSFLGLAFCLAAGGFLTADCVSAEKRDGTLGLLFLTPLNGMDIVLGKMVCHGLQTFYGMCAVFPVFFLPLLTGGVTWSEVGRILCGLSLALVLSASVGMLVSVLATESRQAMAGTFVSIVLIASVPMLYWMLGRLFPSGFGHWLGPRLLSPVFTIVAAFDSNYGRPGSGVSSFWSSLAVMAVLSVGLVTTSGVLLGRVFRVGGSKDSSDEAWCGSRCRRVGAIGDEENPYEWVVLSGGQSSLGILLHFALLFFAAMLAVALATPHWREGFISAFFTAAAVHGVAKLRHVVEVTRQINSDWQSGAVELLLVSTMPEFRVVEGHQEALRRISRKLLVLLVGLNLTLELCALCFQKKLHIGHDDLMIFSILFVGGIALAGADFRALSWLGLWQGLRTRTHVKAVLVTFGLVMGVSWVGLGLAIAFATSGTPRSTTLAVAFLTWIASSLIYDWLLVRRCRTRLRSDFRQLASEGT